MSGGIETARSAGDTTVVGAGREILWNEAERASERTGGVEAYGYREDDTVMTEVGRRGAA